MTWKGIKHIDVGDELTKAEWTAEATHTLEQGTDLPAAPNDYDLFLKTDDNHLYIYIPD